MSQFYFTIFPLHCQQFYYNSYSVKLLIKLLSISIFFYNRFDKPVVFTYKPPIAWQYSKRKTND